MKPWLKTTSATAAVIAAMLATHYEGERLTAYQDVNHVWTICDGHTAGVQKGDKATAAECQTWKEDDMSIADAQVRKCITAALNVNQQAAFDDATFNVGPKVVCGSTLQRLANDGDVLGACEQLKRWTYSGGVKYQGLINRRADDAELCYTEPL